MVHTLTGFGEKGSEREKVCKAEERKYNYIPWKDSMYLMEQSKSTPSKLLLELDWKIYCILYTFFQAFILHFSPPPINKRQYGPTEDIQDFKDRHVSLKLLPGLMDPFHPFSSSKPQINTKKPPLHSKVQPAWESADSCHTVYKLLNPN